MSLSDKLLYHQIHPLKLGTDIIFGFISLYFFWQRELIFALALHITPPLIASVLVVSFADLIAQPESAFGRYVKRMMTHSVEALRLAGDIIAVFGAWYHSYAVIAAGLLIVLSAWLSGLILKYGRA